MRPPPGLCLPCRVTRVIDGDTVEITVTGGLAWRIRLIGVNCPELRHAGGKEARRFTESALRTAGEIYVWVPVPGPLWEIQNLAKLLSFERVPGDLWLSDSQLLSEALLAAGHARQGGQ